MVCSEVTKRLAFALIPNNYIMSANLDVFTDEDRFGFCQSSLHEVWARQHSSKLESRLKYSPGNALETFAFPAGFPDTKCSSLGELGSQLHQARAKIMQADGIGLTKLYNRFHAANEHDPRVEGLRALHRALDIAAVCAYGWDDLRLEHGFHEVSYLPENDRVRFTISEAARIEVLRRLSELNRQRYEEEVAQGLHGSAAQRTSARAPRARRITSAATAQPSFDFESGAAATVNSATPATAILGFLKTNDGWHAKTYVLAATGITDGQWNTGIADLIAGGRVERQGERRGARYRATDAGRAAR